MEHNLKKSLEIIKARARKLRARRETGTPDRRDPEKSAGGEATTPDTPRVVSTADPSVDGAELLAAFKTGEPKPLEDIEPGRELAADGRVCYLITSTGRDVDPEAPQAAKMFGRLRAWPRHAHNKPFEPAHRRRAARTPRPQAAPFDPAKVCFLDIETTGLSPNTYLFLCGLMFLKNEDFVVEQVFARDYAEEAGVLGYVRDRLGDFDTIVTYNGVKFDLPFVMTRMAVCRLEPPGSVFSVDLLHSARRVFRGVLADNKLGTVERHLRGRERTGDIPGRFIPQAYHDYVDSRDARAMKTVLYHNRMDLFTMAVLVNHLESIAST